MTNVEMLDDLKQYIDLKNTALENSIKSELKEYVNSTVREVVSESTETILSALGDKAGVTDSKLDDHEIRLSKLETQIV